MSYKKRFGVPLLENFTEPKIKMTDNVEMGDIGDAPGDNGYGGGSSADYKENLNDDDRVKAELISALLGKVNLSTDDLIEISGLNEDTINGIRESRYEDSKISNKPFSWDYVLAFNCGDSEKTKKPSKSDLKRKEAENIPDSDEWKEGIPEPKYNGQIMNDFMKRLTYAKLALRTFISADKKIMFVLVGITEANLKLWADLRDSDLLINPKGAIKVGVECKFPLALRTEKGQIDPSNWENLYVEYHPNANPEIYTKYNRIKNDESIKTVFDEKTRLRIIYECITTDQNDGGAEIAVTDLVSNRKHPLIACFPLHDQDKLDIFNKTWIKNWKFTDLAWCPLAEIRDYFGEPVAFYFGFLSFYMKWLIAPSVIGVIFFGLQMGGVGSFKKPAFDIPGLFLMGAIIIFWNVAFVDFWQRQEARYRMQWGMTKYSEKAVARPQFKGEWKPDPISGVFSEQFDWGKKLCRLTAVFSFLMFFLSMCVAGVIAVLIVKDADPNNLALKIGLGVANGVMIAVFNVIYKITSAWGNDYENHKTQQDYEDALITKGFIFKFINSFSSLFYLGFIRPGVKGLQYYVHYYDTVCADAIVQMSQYVSDYADPQRQFASSFIEPKDQKGNVVTSCSVVKTDTDNCITQVFDDNTWKIVYEGYAYNTTATTVVNVEPVCDFYSVESGNVVAEQNEAVLNELFFQLATLFGTALVIQNVFEVGIPFLVEKCKGVARVKEAKKSGGTLQPQSEAEKQAEKIPYDNTIEDMTELIVQFGYVTLFVIAFPLTPLLALFNNILEMKVDAINLVKTSQRPHPNGSKGLGSWNSVLAFFSIISVATNVGMLTFRTGIVAQILQGSTGGQWIFFSITSVSIALLVALEKWIIPDVPDVVTKVEERQRLVESVLVRRAKVDEFEEHPPDMDEEDIGNDDLPFDPNRQHIDIGSLQPIPLENLQWQKFNDDP